MNQLGRRWLAALAIVAAFPIALTAKEKPEKTQETFKLEQVELQNAGVEGLLEQQSSWLTRDDDAQVKGVPSSKGQVYLFTGTIGGRDVVGAITVNNRTRTLHLDLNNNGDLSDDPPVVAQRVKSLYDQGWSQSYRFGPLRFEESQKPSTLSGSANEDSAAKTSKPNQENRSKRGLDSADFFVEQIDTGYLIVRPAVCRKGTIRVNNKSYMTVLIDANFNGRYNDIGSPKRRGAEKTDKSDIFAIDRNANGVFDFDEFRISELQPLTKLIQFQDSFYTVTVAQDGSSVTLDSQSPAMGKLDLGATQADLVVSSADTGIIRLRCAGQPCSLPIGKYQLQAVQLRAMDEKKVEWGLSSNVIRNNIEIAIDVNKPATLKLGPPLTMTVAERSDRNSLSGRIVSFNVTCKDAAGVEYQVGATRGGTGNRAPAPSVKILDEAGAILSTGQFEYG